MVRRSKPLSAVQPSIRELRLIDAEAEPSFDRLTGLASRVLEAPVALVSIVEEEADRQFFKSQVGLTEPWATRRQTPLSHSFCKHVKERNENLIVQNSSQDDLVQHNKAVSDLKVAAYLGVPIHGADHQPVGALCVIDHEPRDWTADDVKVLEDIGSLVSNEIQLRAELLKSEQLYAALVTEYDRVNRYTAMRESIALAFMTPDLPVSVRFEKMLSSACEIFGMTSGAIIRMSGNDAVPVFSFNEPQRVSQADHEKDSRALARIVAQSQQILALPDLTEAKFEIGMEPPSRGAGSYIGVPLIFDGVLNGVIEFHSPERRDTNWTEDELSISNILALLASTNLQVLGELNQAKRSEAALLGQLIEFETSRPSLDESIA